MRPRWLRQSLKDVPFAAGWRRPRCWSILLTENCFCAEIFFYCQFSFRRGAMPAFAIDQNSSIVSDALLGGFCESGSGQRRGACSDIGSFGFGVIHRVRTFPDGAGSVGAESTGFSGSFTDLRPAIVSFVADEGALDSVDSDGAL